MTDSKTAMKMSPAPLDDAVAQMERGTEGRVAVNLQKTAWIFPPPSRPGDLIYHPGTGRNYVAVDNGAGVLAWEAK